jgi:hypothetical protein
MRSLIVGKNNPGESHPLISIINIISMLYALLRASGTRACRSRIIFPLTVKKQARPIKNRLFKPAYAVP